MFELTPTKLPHYTLPLYPALFVLAAAFMIARKPISKIVSVIGLAGLGGAALILALAGTGLAIALHGPWWLAVPAAFAAPAAAWFAHQRRPWLALAAAIPLYATILQLTLPNMSALWIAPRVEAALRHDWPQWNPTGAGLAVAGYAEPSLVFECGTDMKLLPDGRAAAQALAARSVSMVLVEHRAEKQFLENVATLKLPLLRLDTIEGFNISRGRSVALTAFRAY